jgi:hypothetical protein
MFRFEGYAELASELVADGLHCRNLSSLLLVPNLSYTNEVHALIYLLLKDIF